jgi:hypothetical protein
MNDRLTDQIRSYTEAMYATATPVAELAPSVEETSSAAAAGPVQVNVEPAARSRPGRRLVGPVVGLAAALAVLVAALPLLLVGDGPDQGDTASTPAGIATPAAPGDLFEGRWVGEDPTDGSTNSLTVDDGTATYRESRVRACLTQFGQMVSGSAVGPAIIEGSRLSFVGTLYCDLEQGRTVHPAFENVEWVFEHDPETDQLTLNLDAKTRLGRAGNQ